jgi:outer membrane murein-binding lipoprotein Lpp
MMRCFIVNVVFGVLLLTGCSSLSSVPKQHTSQPLAQMLASLERSIPKEEAARLAADLQYTSQRLNRQFERTTTPKLHNFLINMGIKRRGLCYHYSDALYIHVKKGNYPHFGFHLAGANIGSYWREHNALVVTAKGKPVEEGLIIDAWRDPAGLYVIAFKKDPDYHWLHRPERGCCLP